MGLLTKLIVKVTHAKTTTLCLLREAKGDLPREDSKLLYDFLVEDWVNVLLGKKEFKKS